MWEKELIEQLKLQAKTYPTKALLDQLLDLFDQQVERLNHLQGQMDGTSWSPELWRQERSIKID